VSDTWIGHGAVIMPSVEIGTGSVIGAGAVVTRDVPAYSVAVGVPAKVIKRRFSERVEKALMEIAWWDWPHDVIKERLPDFTDNMEAFIEKYGSDSDISDRDSIVGDPP
jgi:hypothetical protein